MTQRNLFMKQKQTHRHRKQTYGHQRGIMGGRGSVVAQLVKNLSAMQGTWI